MEPIPGTGNVYIAISQIHLNMEHQGDCRRRLTPRRAGAGALTTCTLSMTITFILQKKIYIIFPSSEIINSGMRRKFSI